MNPYFWIMARAMIEGSFRYRTAARPKPGYTPAQIESMVAELRELLDRHGVEGLIR